MTECIICPVCGLIRIENPGRCWKCGTTYNQAIKICKEKEALSLAELDYAQNLTKIINDGIKTEDELEKQISTLSAKVQELQTELEELGKHHAIHHENEYELQTETEKWKKQTKAHEEFIGEKLREIDKLQAELVEAKKHSNTIHQSIRQEGKDQAKKEMLEKIEKLKTEPQPVRFYEQLKKECSP